MIIGFFNSKGGVMKTTLVQSLAAYLAHTGASVAIIDGDPQLTTAKWAALRKSLAFRA